MKKTPVKAGKDRKAYMAAWRRANKDHTTHYRLNKRYGISKKKRDAMFARQRKRCACCRSNDPGSVRGWYLDHDHKTGKVRGVLCHWCNLALGHAKDSVVRLSLMIIYLEKHKQ